MRLSLHCHKPSDGTAFYRAISPLSHLKKMPMGQDFDIWYLEDSSMNSAMLTDLAFFQRPCTYREVESIRFFKRAGVPVVVDYDDLVLDYPTDLPSYFEFAEPTIRDAILYCMQEAAAVMVSTPLIKESILRMFPEQRVYVVPNALHPVFHPEQVKPQTNTILWRGTNTHMRDLMTFAGALQDFAANHTDVLTFYGYYPWFLENVIPKAQFEVEKPQGSVPNYLARLKQIAPRFGIVPLHDSPFNRAKSNLAWLEMTWAGAVCLVPNWPEWDHPGNLTYSGPGDFLSKLEQLVHLSEQEMEEMRLQSWNHLCEHYSLGRVNRLREQIFLAAVGKMPWPDDHNWRKSERALEEANSENDLPF